LKELCQFKKQQKAERESSGRKLIPIPVSVLVETRILAHPKKTNFFVFDQLIEECEIKLISPLANLLKSIISKCVQSMTAHYLDQSK
jgi:hypothetical protein